MQLTKNFALKEYACRCGCGIEKTSKILAELKKTAAMDQKIRDHFGKPMTIHSGVRCKAHNAACGGAPKSQHLDGSASDKSIAGVTPNQIATFAATLPEVGGIGIYMGQGFCHTDTRRGRVTWNG